MSENGGFTPIHGHQMWKNGLVSFLQKPNGDLATQIGHIKQKQHKNERVDLIKTGRFIVVLTTEKNPGSEINGD